ncbi:MAG: DUF6232 family protein [Rhizobium sp.]|nr:DUF6232 family protein [Rhizobium sp.]
MTDSIYSSGNIEITKSLVKIGSATYPISNIGSLVVSENPRSVAGSAFVAAVIVGLVFSYGMQMGGVAGVIAGVVAFFVLLLLAGRADPTLRLTLKTSSGDIDALTTTNRKRLEEVKSAIEAAISSR